MCRKEHGSALITALLITAICAVLATAILVNQSIIINEAELVHNADQLYLGAAAENTWSLAQIISKTIKQQNNQPLISTQSSTILPTLVLGDVKVSGLLLDANTRININSLMLTMNQPVLARLIIAIDPDISIKNATLIAESISHWLVASGHINNYLDHKPPFRPGQMPMRNITELKSVLLLNSQNYAINTNLLLRLTPYITALPTRQNRININGFRTINTATPILFALGQRKMSYDNARALASCLINNKPFKNSEELKQRCPQAQLLNESGSTVLTTGSQYYLVSSLAELPHQQLRLTSLLGIERNSKNQPYFHVIWQALS